MLTLGEYQAALDYLFSFVDLSKTHVKHLTPDQFDLNRMAALAEALGAPQREYPVLHIAGTKGKGSVAALCASALQAAGYRTGLYTSPHLEEFRERIQINGEPISTQDLVRLVELIKLVAIRSPGVSTFDLITGLAFRYFADEKVDAAVIEVGLGGRLDSTNVVEPTVCAITSISIDHTPLLGTTLAEIAAEKAGIIKDGIPVVSAPQAEPVAKVLQEIAEHRSAELIQVGQDVCFNGLSATLAGQEFEVWTSPRPERTRLAIPLLGAHQVENAVVAYAVLRRFGSLARPISDQGIREGFAGVRWPGRFELLRQQPYVILDAAHNRDSAFKLRKTLDTYFPSQPLIMMLGVSADKDAAAFFDAFRDRAEEWILTRSTHPRAMPPEELAVLVERDGKRLHIADPIEAALELGLKRVPPAGVLLITGSVFVAGAARSVWFSSNP